MKRFFNNQLFDEIITPDSEIRYAIEIASSNIDYLSGFTISKKWPEINPTKFTDNIQTATTHYVNFLLSKGVEYARGQASIGQGGIVYSQNNPEDPYYIVPQVFNYLKEINEYPTMQGFNLNVSPKQNWFKKFMGNGGEQNPWEIYVPFTNIKSSDDRTKITITHPKNIMGSVVDIDTRGIKTDIDNSLWEVDKDNPNFIKPKDDKGIDVNGRRIIDVGTPTFLSDATTKQYVDDLLDKKQCKLSFGDNLVYDEANCKLSAIGGKVDLTDYYKKEDFPKSYFIYDESVGLAPLATYPCSLVNILLYNNDYPDLNTINKRIIHAINELNANIDKKQDKLISTEEVVIEDNKITFTKEFLEKIGDFIIHFQQFDDLTTVSKILINAINELNKKLLDFMLVQPIIKNEVWKDVAFNESTSGYKNQAIRYDCKENKRYRIWFNLSPRQEKIIIPDLYTFTEFIYSLGTGIPQTKTVFSTYIKEGGRLQLLCSRNEYLDVFKWEDMNTTGGNLWKLQELQE